MTKEELLALLASEGIASVDVYYSGSGDSGNMEDVEVTYQDGRKAEYLDLGDPLCEAIVNFCWDELESRHGGWETNDGGDGHFEITVEDATIILIHGYGTVVYHDAEVID